MNGLINQYGSPFLFLINLILWFLYYRNLKSHPDNQVTVRNFIIFLLIFNCWNFSSIISNLLSRQIGIIVWLIFWVMISIYELFFVLTVLFRLAKAKKDYSDIFVIIIAILAVPIILAAILTWTNRSYSPINTTDFYNIILLMLGSILILRNLLGQSSFVDYLESFFIFSGFILYFALHIVASNALSIDFIRNWNFGQYATLTSLIFWLGSILFIWKIRSKHS